MPDKRNGCQCNTLEGRPFLNLFLFKSYGVTSFSPLGQLLLSPGPGTQPARWVRVQAGPSGSCAQARRRRSGEQPSSHQPRGHPLGLLVPSQTGDQAQCSLFYYPTSLSLPLIFCSLFPSIKCFKEEKKKKSRETKGLALPAYHPEVQFPVPFLQAQPCLHTSTPKGKTKGSL